MEFKHFKRVEDGTWINVVQGKTGAREIVAPAIVWTLVEELRALDRDVGETMRLWNAGDYSHMMKRHLRELGMETDSHGHELTLYCTRHYFITKGPGRNKRYGFHGGRGAIV